MHFDLRIACGNSFSLELPAAIPSYVKACGLYIRLYVKACGLNPYVLYARGFSITLNWKLIATCFASRQSFAISY